MRLGESWCSQLARSAGSDARLQSTNCEAAKPLVEMEPRRPKRCFLSHSANEARQESDIDFSYATLVAGQDGLTWLPSLPSEVRRYWVAYINGPMRGISSANSDLELEEEREERRKLPDRRQSPATGSSKGKPGQPAWSAWPGAAAVRLGVGAVWPGHGQPSF